MAWGRAKVVAISAVAFVGLLTPAALALRPEPPDNGPVRAGDAQGPGHLSPILGADVNLTAVVTAAAEGGFWAQDPVPDGRPETSDALFVRSPATVAVGDLVRLRGEVRERRAAPAALSRTELEPGVVEVVTPNSPLPAPVRLDIGARTVTPGNAESGYTPATDLIDYYESLEGMRVELPSSAALGPTTGGRLAVAPGVTLTGAVPEAGTGDQVVGPITGVLGADGTLAPAAEPSVVKGPRVPRPARPQAGSELVVATLNARGLDPSDPRALFTAVADEVVTGLAAPDLLVVQGVQDNSGPEPDGTVAADQTVAQLIDEISATGGPAYDWRSVDPEHDADGGEPGANSRVGFLFRSDRGLAVADRPGDAATATAAAPGGSLTLSPGRVAPADPAWKDVRKPVAAEFTWQGRRLVVVANHWAATGEDDPYLGVNQPPRRPSAAQHTAAAALVSAFAKSLSPTLVLVAGEFNTDAPVPGLTDPSTALPAADRYSRRADGRPQPTTRILHTPTTAALKFEYVHLNADFAPTAAYTDPALLRLTF